MRKYFSVFQMPIFIQFNNFIWFARRLFALVSADSLLFCECATIAPSAVLRSGNRGSCILVVVNGYTREQEFGSWFVDRWNFPAAPLTCHPFPPVEKPPNAHCQRHLHASLGPGKASLEKENFRTKRKILSASGRSMQKAMRTAN